MLKIKTKKKINFQNFINPKAIFQLCQSNIETKGANDSRGIKFGTLNLIYILRNQTLYDLKNNKNSFLF